MIRANFNAYGSYVTDSVTQWDKNQVLSVTGLNLVSAPEVHFSNASMRAAIVRQAEMSDHIVTVKIPNSLLQSPLTIKAEIGVYEGSTFKTVELVEIPVRAAKKPEDYSIADDEEIYSFNRIENELANKANNARVDHIIAHNNDTAGNTELLDIRTDVNGNSHSSAGEAVRKQIKNVTGVICGKSVISTSEMQTDIMSENVIEINVPAYFPKNQRLKLKYNTVSAKVGANSVGYLGITDADTETEIAHIVTLVYNKEVEIITPFNVSKFRLYITDIQSYGDLQFEINSVGSFAEIIELNKQIKTLPKSIGIIGDSYSAYENWIPSDYVHWYSDNGNALTNDITDVTQMWWWKLCNETHRKLLRNSSFSGTTICNTGENGADVSATSFISRIVKDFGLNRTLEDKPDEIYIFGGTNDTWLNSPIGSVMYSDWTENDLKSVLPAFCYMIDYIYKYNPGVKIYNIVNDLLDESIKQGMTVACDYYGVTNIVLSNISKDNSHPNKNGMDQIKTQIINVII